MTDDTYEKAIDAASRVVGASPIVEFFDYDDEGNRRAATLAATRAVVAFFDELRKARVRKKSGSNWHGRIVGFYSTGLTPIGYAVESEREPGSVQIYPASALEIVGEDDGHRDTPAIIQARAAVAVARTNLDRAGLHRDMVFSDPEREPQRANAHAEYVEWSARLRKAAEDLQRAVDAEAREGGAAP